MGLPAADRALITERLGREITDAEAALFENLWSEHCAYRSSWGLLGAFESDGQRVVVGPGDDAAVVKLTNEYYLTMGIESHNHPSYVDPYDGAATGVGGIVRDTLSMGAYPIALADCLYFGDFDREHSLYLFEGVVEGIADYGNAIGVPTVAGSVQFHDAYEGNPLVNVACLGLVHADRLVTATATTPGNRLVLVGNPTGRDGLGGASFASEDLSADAETEDRPAVQVGDPYSEKLLIEANEALLDAEVVEAARDLGAAGLGGATSEMVAKGSLGVDLTLDAVHQREPGMNVLEILLAESQERMCYEVRPEAVETVKSIADQYELGCSVIGTLTDTGQYRCGIDGERVVDLPAEFLCDGAPLNELPTRPPESPAASIPDLDLAASVDAMLAHPNTASKEWIYRQYDHEVGVRTAVPPGDDAAVLSIREADRRIALTAGADANWTTAAPYEGAKAVALETATNLAVKGATPLAAVDCLNGGNPETPRVYHGFSEIVSGLADMCSVLDVPVVGGNVSLYNDSPSGPIPPTPTLAMAGVMNDRAAPPMTVTGEGTICLIGDVSTRLGGSQILADRDGHDAFPELPAAPLERVQGLVDVACSRETLAIHDVSHGGLAVTLAEMVGPDTGMDVDLDITAAGLLSEQVGRAVVETTDPGGLERQLGETAPIHQLGPATESGGLRLSCTDGELGYDFETITERRSTIDARLG